MDEPGGTDSIIRQRSILVDSAQFQDLISLRAAKLLAFCQYIRIKRGNFDLNLMVISFISGEAMMLEELIDTYGARNNQSWYLFRSLIGSLKAFSAVCFELLHLLRTSRLYVDFPNRSEYVDDTKSSLQHCSQVIFGICCALANQAMCLGISLPHYSQFFANYYKEEMPEGFLPRDRKTTRSETAQQRVVSLATEFLNLASKGNVYAKVSRMQEKIFEAIPDVLNEEILMQGLYSYHSLQTLYDTYVSDSDAEAGDRSLNKMRGHISIIYHLFEVITNLVHFYERHFTKFCDALINAGICPGAQQREISALLMYTVKYIMVYQEAGKKLSHDMLKSYAVISKVDVPIPSFRGFHVRPSTLVAKIVQHYGSDVKMILDNAEYNARNPLDFFRANERINALKRHRLGKMIEETKEYDGLKLEECNLEELLRKFVFELAGKNIVFIYQRPLEINEITWSKDDPPLLGNLILRETIKLMGAGKIDVEVDLKATFVGDTRVLKDIEILANNGYCEDSFGNNVPIPPSLPYLQRT